MLKPFFISLLLCCYTITQAQHSLEQPGEPLQDSVKKRAFIKHIGNGYIPTKYFNFDLRYLIKYNQYEGVRTGMGGVTNDTFSKQFRINSYGVYGFRDHRFKYSVGGSIRLAEASNTWLTLSYTDDLEETGSTKFLTDKRFFQFFEPRLLNIDLFHKHITKTVGLEHSISKYLVGETEFAVSNIDPTYNYSYLLDGNEISTFQISTVKVALRWSPFNRFQDFPEGLRRTKNGYPKFSLQYTKSFKDVFKSDFNFSKLDFRTIYRFGPEDHFSEITLVAGVTGGDTPLTHLYHAYPNNITKATIMQRFSVAGTNSFETMFFNEFFSDKFTTLQLKHHLKPFHISQRFKPEMVLITRYALGDIKSPENHLYVNFGSLRKGYTESGFEINKLLFGFGLSFTYRYGAYHLPEFTDNIAFKFTFNVSL